MGRLAYYSPLVIGALLALSMYDVLLRGAAWLPPGLEWLYVALWCVAAGLGAQLLLIGAQGVFAQVLPVPGGRSIRGRGAATAGFLMLFALGCGVGAWLVSSEEFRTPARVLAGLGMAAAAGAILTYVWCWPTAVRDFADSGRAERSSARSAG